MSDYYVYQLVNPISGLPFYVGKGKGNRAFRHEKDVVKHRRHANPLVLTEICEIVDSGLHVEVVFLEQQLTHDEARSIERRVISQVGRRNRKSGPLCNLTDGGEGSLGRCFKHSEESKKKISEAGKKRTETPESNEKRRKAMIGKYKNRVLTDDWKAKISASGKGKIRSVEVRMKISAAKSGSNNPSAKTYVILTPSGDTIKVKSLKTFCDNKALSYHGMLRGKTVNGWKVEQRL